MPDRGPQVIVGDLGLASGRSLETDCAGQGVTIDAIGTIDSVAEAGRTPGSCRLFLATLAEQQAHAPRLGGHRAWPA